MKDEQLFALAVRDKEGKIVQVGSYRYKSINAAVEDAPRCTESRKLHPTLNSPIVAVIDRKDKVVRWL